MQGTEVVKARLGEISGNLLDRETMRDVAFGSSRMIPVLAISAISGAAEDLRQGEGISRSTKVGMAGFAANLAVAAAATIGSQRQI